MIYLDNNSTTKLDAKVLEAMLPFLQDQYANASSNHEFGVSVNSKIKDARSSVAGLIGCEANEIVFTSGATEAINLAIKGVAENYSSKGKHIITVATEHPAVLDTCKYLERIGFEISYLPVDSNGLIDLKQVEKTLRDDTILISVMLVNNETGVIQPLAEISKLARKKGIVVMTDGTQAVGKLPVSVDELGVDLMAFSGHKFYGPKGVGALFVRNRRPNKVRIEPILHGGGHERNLRSGTLNVPGIVGLGVAAEIAQNEMEQNRKHIGLLREMLEVELLKIEGAKLNGSKNKRLYNISNVSFKDIDADAIIAGLENVIVSNGSACSSNKVEPSHVLTQMGLSEQDAYSSVRFSIGKFNTKSDITKAIQKTKAIVEKLRTMIAN